MPAVVTTLPLPGCSLGEGRTSTSSQPMGKHRSVSPLSSRRGDGERTEILSYYCVLLFRGVVNVCSKGFEDIAALLLDQGADLELSNSQGVPTATLLLCCDRPPSHNNIIVVRKPPLMSLPRRRRSGSVISSSATLSRSETPRTAAPRGNHHPRCSRERPGLKLYMRTRGPDTWGSTLGVALGAGM